MQPGLQRLAIAAVLISFVVIVLGAYVRLSHAGLGCPDWPGCYGQLTWPKHAEEIIQANEAFPERPVESGKAWKEMVHRYLAGTLVLLVVAINFMAWKSESPPRIRLQAGILLALILFQAALGMWTVTLKLLPAVVMGHLLGGLATFSLLLWLAWGVRAPAMTEAAGIYRARRPVIIAGLVLLIAQIGLGGWTSANYSALVCTDFPGCQGELWPESNFRDGFTLLREIGADYEGGLLDYSSRIAIHMTHRLGALVVFVMIGAISILLLKHPESRKSGFILGAVLLAQVALGIQNVVFHLPLANAVAHNGVAALLLAAMLRLLYLSGKRAR